MATAAAAVPGAGEGIRGEAVSGDASGEGTELGDDAIQ